MINYTNLLEAYQRLHGIARRTPLLLSETLNSHRQGRVYVKAEMLQHTGSFKFRGAFNKIVQLSEQGVKGVIAYSSGNHAQGVALAAREYGMEAVIVMPSDAPHCKISNTKSLGAEVVLYDRKEPSRRENLGHELAASRNLTLIKPFDDYDIIAGQGTVAIEAYQDLQMLGESLHTLVVPCGGGGLLSGCAIATRQSFPQASIWAAEPAAYDDTARSLEAGERLSNEDHPPTICDGIVTASPGELTFPILQKYVDGGVTVTDAEVERAMRFCIEEFKIVAEPSGAVALAAIMAGKIDTKAKTTLVILSGGNVDTEILAKTMAASQ